MPEVHWPRGGSNSGRILVCPGSVNEAAKWPADPSGKAAIEGTHDHTVLEECVKGNYPDAGLLLDKEMEDHEGKFVVTEDRVDRVNAVLNYIWPKIREGGMQVWSEAFVDAGALHGVGHWGGSIDITLFSIRPEEVFLELLDYKGGGKPVRPDTPQLVTYGLGVLNEFHKLGLQRPTKIRCTIVQPKVYQEPRWVEYTYEEFMAKAQPLIESMRLSMHEDAPRSAGDHCTYCPGAKAGRCPEFNKGAQVALDEVFANVPTVTTVTTAGEFPVQGAQLQALPIQLPEIDENTPIEKLAAIIDAKPLILAIIKEAEEEANRRAKSGKQVPGQKLVRASTHRRWAKDALEQLKKMRLKSSVYTDEKLKSPKQVLESDEVKGLSEARRKRLEELIVKPEGALVLVPESDPREAVQQSLEKIFEDVSLPAPTAPAEPAPVKKPLSFL